MCIHISLLLVQKTILSRKKFVITGSLKKLTRAQVKQKIEFYDARLSSSISKNTDFLILGENPGSKLNKAKQMNIQIINEEQFLTMLEDA